MYRITAINREGTPFSRKCKTQKQAERLWNEVNGAHHIIFAVWLCGEKQLARYVA